MSIWAVGNSRLFATQKHMNKLEYIDRNLIKPYPNNPRNNDEAVKYVANSIKSFGFQSPIIVDKNMVVIAGHTRLRAAEKLNLDTVPVIVAADLTDEQAKALRLADNKVSEKAEWDFELLDSEISEILEFDMYDFGFEFESVIDDIDDPEDDDGYFGDERQRTNDAYNLEAFDSEKCSGYYQMPIIEQTDYAPEGLVGFNYVLSANEDTKRNGVHFYVDDYQFERIWNDPDTYIKKLKEFDCVLSPDFSLYMDMPIAMKIWNVYRSRLIGQMCQKSGIIVIPTISWAEPETYKFCFDGIEPGGTVSVSTVGIKRNDNALKVFKDGCSEMIRRLKPTRILLYGGKVDFDFGNIEIVEYSNSVTDRMNNYRKE